MAEQSLRRRLWRWGRLPIFVLAALVIIPALLVPVYALINPISMPMLARTLTGQNVTRIWQPLDAISDRLKSTVMMSEDGQFCRHHGVDLGALRAEFNIWRAGKTPRGASTITMQVARNLFLWNGRSYVRKALEVPLAFYLDLILSKHRIMEIYLNIAEWGPDGEFGIAAGAERAFGVSAANFTWQRAGLLAVTLPNPHLRHPARPNRGLGRLASIVIGRAKASTDYTSCLFGTHAPAL